MRSGFPPISNSHPEKSNNDKFEFDYAITDDAARGRLTAAEEVALALAIARGDNEARNRLVRANLGLVVTIARSYLGRGLSLDDLVGEGNLGLIRAADEYDPSFGTRFSTYAAHWIKQAIRHALLNTTSTIRLPVYLARLLSQWRSMERQLYRERGYFSDAREVSTRLGLSEEQHALVEKARRAHHAVSENRERQEKFGSFTDQLVDSRASVESELVVEEDRSAILENLKQLDARERSILSCRYGLNGKDPLSLSETSRRFGMTRETVRTVERRALRKLKYNKARQQGSSVSAQTERAIDSARRAASNSLILARRLSNSPSTKLDASPSPSLLLMDNRN